jgi:hypothetical protein
LRQVGGFLWFPPPIKTETLLKVALNIIKQTNKQTYNNIIYKPAFIVHGDTPW